jgi:hypothetical protein
MACTRKRTIHRVAERRLSQSRSLIQPSRSDAAVPLPSKQALKNLPTLSRPYGTKRAEVILWGDLDR